MNNIFRVLRSTSYTMCVCVCGLRMYCGCAFDSLDISLSSMRAAARVVHSILYVPSSLRSECSSCTNTMHLFIHLQGIWAHRNCNKWMYQTFLTQCNVIKYIFIYCWFLGAKSFANFVRQKCTEGFRTTWFGVWCVHCLLWVFVVVVVVALGRRIIFIFWWLWLLLTQIQIENGKFRIQFKAECIYIATILVRSRAALFTGLFAIIFCVFIPIFFIRTFFLHSRLCAFWAHHSPFWYLIRAAFWFCCCETRWDEIWNI